MNTAETIRLIEKQYTRSDLPKLSVGDTVKMKVKVAEADKIRVHPFEGTIIKITGGSGIKSSFTVRKVSFGEGIERVFPLHSPVIESIQIVSKGKTKRARLYFLRNRAGKGAKLTIEQEKQEK